MKKIILLFVFIVWNSFLLTGQTNDVEKPIKQNIISFFAMNKNLNYSKEASKRINLINIENFCDLI